jgi:hypothetical protein
MTDWLHNLPIVWMALLVFGLTALVTAAIYVVIDQLILKVRAPAAAQAGRRYYLDSSVSLYDETVSLMFEVSTSLSLNDVRPLAIRLWLIPPVQAR